MKLGKAIEYAQDAETELATQLQIVAERHAAEHDLYHLGHTLAQQSGAHVQQLAPFAEKYGVTPHPEGIRESPSVISAVRQKSAELMGRSEPAGLLLLRDLRHLYLTAQQAEIAWVILMQAARAIRDAELQPVAETCREQAETCGAEKAGASVRERGRRLRRNGRLLGRLTPSACAADATARQDSGSWPTAPGWRAALGACPASPSS
jgi:hypothetical protein